MTITLQGTMSQVDQLQDLRSVANRCLPDTWINFSTLSLCSMDSQTEPGQDDSYLTKLSCWVSQLWRLDDSFLDGHPSRLRFIKILCGFHIRGVHFLDLLKLPQKSQPFWAICGWYLHKTSEFVRRKKRLCFNSGKKGFEVDNTHQRWYISLNSGQHCCMPNCSNLQKSQVANLRLKDVKKIVAQLLSPCY